MKRESCYRWRRWGAVLPVFILLAGLFLPARAFAQCEQSASARAALAYLAWQDVVLIGQYTAQEVRFASNKLTMTATYEVQARLDEFDGNIRNALNVWADHTVKAWKKMTAQLSVAQVEQTREIGAMMDAQLLNEAMLRRNEHQADAHRRYLPSEMSCQADTAGPGQTRSYQMSRAYNRALALEDSPRRGNAKGSISSTGSGAEIKSLWGEYVSKFCDNTKGDQGCSAPGTLAGRHKDIPALLWGDRQTIDMSVADNRLVVKAALRYLIAPESPDPILPGAAQSAGGQQALLSRHVGEARINTIYNVMGQMVGERAGGSGVNTQSMRIAAGIPAAEASTNASYREIQEAMTKDRFYNPQYIMRIVGNPEQVVREQISINATRLQVMNDIYRRSEELLFMEAAAYSHDLDKQMPSSAVRASILR